VDLKTCFPVETSGGRITVSTGGSGPPLLLLHGFPQTRMMWAPVIDALSRHHALVLPDLPGYGDSDPPLDVAAASKRAMGNQMIEVMRALGHDRFDVAGHDRGGRVAYRMALDHPQAVKRLALLDILPTSEYWARMDRAFAIKIYHWAFLAQPAPFPETLIGAAPDAFLETTLKSWTATRSLDCFATDAMAAYRANFTDAARLKAMCDDYRAGADIDVTHDLADREANRRITAETLILWGASGIAQSAHTPLDTWRDWCENVEGHPIESGHFIPEENPSATIDALGTFFSR
jgi:haloacetate dehalogenase